MARLATKVLFVVCLTCCSIAYGGLLLHWLLDGLLLALLVFLGPLLLNREQMIALLEQPPAVRDFDLEGVPATGDSRTLSVLSYNLFMRPGLWFIKVTSGVTVALVVVGTQLGRVFEGSGVPLPLCVPCCRCGVGGGWHSARPCV
jgi:hypothetical protein